MLKWCTNNTNGSMSVGKVRGKQPASRPQVSTQELGAKKVIGNICTLVKQGLILFLVVKSKVIVVLYS